MNCSKIFENLYKNSLKFLLLFVCFLSLTFSWQGGLFNNTNIANAAILNSNHELLADLGDSGLKNQVEGRVQQEVGKMQGAIDEAGDELQKSVERADEKTDAMSKQVKGRAQQEMGKAQEKLQETGNRVEDKTDNALDAVKDFFLGD